MLPRTYYLFLLRCPRLAAKTEDTQQPVPASPLLLSNWQDFNVIKIWFHRAPGGGDSGKTEVYMYLFPHN
jgi:hypothetical protein